MGRVGNCPLEAVLLRATPGYLPAPLVGTVFRFAEHVAEEDGGENPLPTQQAVATHQINHSSYFVNRIHP